MSAVLTSTELFQGLPAEELRALGQRTTDLRGKVKVLLTGEPEVVLAVTGPGGLARNANEDARVRE